MDAHSRDITDKLYQEGVVKDDEFQWQSQLKAYPEDRPFDDGSGNFPDFKLKISDARFWYGYEYLGNGPRLVITPLTDRIYVTACQSLHLKMGCAPAGPAGTGKTETTKDLASAMGKAVYVFNCSDQMDYKSMAGIFKGIASSGSWVCFDEFNRLVPEVLSVCTVQFKSVTDAIRNGQKRFIIQDDEIDLDPTCGAYITMNPGYLGRSELPEGL
jgi:dynein heavy chain